MVIRPALFRQHPVLAALSTRRGGVSAEPYGMNLSFSVGDDPNDVLRNRQLFYGSLRIGLDTLAIPKQVHSSKVLAVRQAGEYLECDGLVTDKEQIFLCVTFADCLPLLLYAPDVRAIGAIHAGWRGTSAGIGKEGVRQLTAEFGADPSKLLGFIGPAAGVCCYEVGQDVVDRFDPRYIRKSDGHWYADLKGAIAGQLRDSGVSVNHLEIHPSCTIKEPVNYHSFRRDGARSGRMMAVIGISQKEW